MKMLIIMMSSFEFFGSIWSVLATLSPGVDVRVEREEDHFSFMWRNRSFRFYGERFIEITRGCGRGLFLSLCRLKRRINRERGRQSKEYQKIGSLYS